MQYEEMLEHQDNQTYFEIEDAISALPVQICIADSDTEYWPDSIELKSDTGDLINIDAADALNLLAWLEHHKGRLLRRAEMDAQAILKQSAKQAAVQMKIIATIPHEMEAIPLTPYSGGTITYQSDGVEYTRPVQITTENGMMVVRSKEQGNE